MSSQGLGQAPQAFQPFEYINPLIRGNQMMDQPMMYGYGPEYSYTTNQTLSTQDNSLMIQEGFMSESTTTENVPPLEGDLTQYINPEIHRFGACYLAEVDLCFQCSSCFKEQPSF